MPVDPAIGSGARLVDAHEPERPAGELRERLREGAVDEPPGDGPAVEVRLDGVAERHRAVHHGAVGKAERERLAVAVGGRGDLHERARELAVDQPAVVVDQVKATVLADARPLQLDLVDLDEAEALHRRVA